MKIKSKIFIILIILLVSLNTSVYAIDMFLNSSSLSNTAQTTPQNNTSEENNLNTLPNTNTNENTNNTTVSEEQNGSTPIITSTVRNNSLTISDIIGIILIAVCIVLILLAIAILIRCK